MSTIFDAYNLHVNQLVDFYRRLNTPITYPDGMVTSLGIIYWGREQHRVEIESGIPRLLATGISRFDELLQALKTPARVRKLSEQSGIAEEILRILKHDIALWLPEAVSLATIDEFQPELNCTRPCSQIGLSDQLGVISAGQTPLQRAQLALQTNLEPLKIDEIVRACDFCRTGKNLEHIRAQIYYAMGLDTWQKWANETASGIIARFRTYIQENQLAGERLVPWPKEVRNGIEWAKLHLEIYTVVW